MNTKPQKKSYKKSGKLWDAFSVAIGVSKKPKKVDSKDKTVKKTVATSTVKKPESVKKPATTTKKTVAEHGRKVRKTTTPKPAVKKTVKAGTKKLVMKGCGCGK